MTATPREPDAPDATSSDVPDDAANDVSSDVGNDVANDVANDRVEDAPVRLLQADELHAVVSKWREIQAEFVDQPKRAMQEADELVSELMDRLARTFAEQRQQLEARWSETESVSTEELRRGLQRYRSFFERLLAA